MLNRVGELLIVGFKGTELPDWLREFADNYGLGGVILFDYDVASKSYRRNIVGPKQLKTLCQQLAELPSRPLIFVDQEGGRVRRLKEKDGFCPYPSAADFARLPRQERLSLTRQSFEELRDLGIHYTLAPVIDINRNPDNPDIGAIGRSYSADAEQVSENISILAEVAREVNLGLCLKHFPGIGASTVDSHKEVMHLDIDKQQIELFSRWCNEINGKAILVSHAHTEWDRSLPMSLSRQSLRRLRSACGDQILLLSDDIQMEAIWKKEWGQHSSLAIAVAIEAGIDMVIIGNNLRSEERYMFDFAERIKSVLYVDEEDTGTKLSKEMLAFRKRTRVQVKESLERISVRKDSLYH